MLLAKLGAHEKSLCSVMIYDHVLCRVRQMFVKDNQDGSEKTRIDYLGFIGTPVNATNMADFKRVRDNITVDMLQQLTCCF